jgi:5-methyltetrahydropteroyltriglutamate--homocysteine methyltransferase
MAIPTTLGYPRIGKNRELKKATEAYWSGKLGREDLLATGRELRSAAWQVQAAAGVSLIPSNDFSYYDHVLDTIAMTGCIPERYGHAGGELDLDTYFAMARGSTTKDLPAMEMTKWFNSNYHYIVPEFSSSTEFSLCSTKPLDEFAEAKSAGLISKPILLGPVTFLLLGKSIDNAFNALDLLDRLLPVYGQVVEGLAAQGAEWIQFDEPICVTDRPSEVWEALDKAYRYLAGRRGQSLLSVQTYFDQVGDAYSTLIDLPVEAIGLDFVHDGGANRRLIADHGFPEDKLLVAGIVDGRNVWANDLEASVRLLQGLNIPPDRLIIAPAASLMFVPIDVELEEDLNPEVKSWLAFAKQKLAEIGQITAAVNGEPDKEAVAARSALIAARRSAASATRPDVRDRVRRVSDSDHTRSDPFSVRKSMQEQALGLPPLPTTTIGSFPQTPEVRRYRRQFESGTISTEEYDAFIADQVRKLLRFQEEVGLDVLVHGEFERSDMVEYFGERMSGFLFTRHGWVQSYGSRYVRPPIIYGDVARPEPMTVKWFKFAQADTDRPVKGMLTGPVTILAWSFVRDDQSPSETCTQIALALRDEVVDLERAGAKVIQIDEPALREKLPLREADWAEFLDWAIRCFRLASSGVGPQTQIHTHMCYSDFNSIIESIQAMDADVVSIESSRSDRELLRAFTRVRYTNDIGPGVYDIHSPRVPSTHEMTAAIEANASVIPIDQLWVNPDCGLKTRRWEEVEPSLRNMMKAALACRQSMAVPA